MGLRKRVVWENWEGGDYGRRWPGKTEPSTFRAVNVWHYTFGVGPRLPMIRSTPSSALPTEYVLWADSGFAILSDGKGYNLSNGNATATLTSSTESLGTAVGDSSNNFVIAKAAGTPVILNRASTPSFTANANQPYGYRMVKFGYHFVTADGDNIYWSAPDDATTWPVLNFAPLPAGRRLLDMQVQQNTLLLVMDGEFRSGVDLYVVNGTLGVDASMRRVDSGPAFWGGEDYAGNVFVAPGGIAYWMTAKNEYPFNGGQIGFAAPSPVYRIYNSPSGYDYDQFTTLPGGEPTLYSFARSIDVDSYIAATSFPENDPSYDATTRRALFAIKRSDHAVRGWTVHDPGVEFRSQNGGRSANVAGGRSDVTVWTTGVTLNMLTQGRDGVQAPKLYQMSLEGEFPLPFSDGDTSLPVTADFRTADWWEDQGGEVFVRSVLVDYSYADYGVRPTLEDEARFDISIESLNKWNSDDYLESGAVRFVPPDDGRPSDADESIVRRGRQVFHFGDQAGGEGFRIHITNWRGIIIHRIVADIDVQAPRD